MENNFGKCDEARWRAIDTPREGKLWITRIGQSYWIFCCVKLFNFIPLATNIRIQISHLRYERWLAPNLIEGKQGFNFAGTIIILRSVNIERGQMYTGMLFLHNCIVEIYSFSWRALNTGLNINEAGQ